MWDARRILKLAEAVAYIIDTQTEDVLLYQEFCEAIRIYGFDKGEQCRKLLTEHCPKLLELTQLGAT